MNEKWKRWGVAAVAGLLGAILGAAMMFAHVSHEAKLDQVAQQRRLNVLRRRERTGHGETLNYRAQERRRGYRR